MTQYQDHDNYNNTKHILEYDLGNLQIEVLTFFFLFFRFYLASHISVNYRPIVLKFLGTFFDIILQHEPKVKVDRLP